MLGVDAVSDVLERDSVVCNSVRRIVEAKVRLREKLQLRVVECYRVDVFVTLLQKGRK